MNTQEVNKDVVTRWVRALAAARLDEARDYAAPDCVWWVVGMGEFDRQTIRDFWDSWASPNAVAPGTEGLKILSMTAEADRVAVEVEGDIILPDGRNYQNVYFFLFTFRDGRFTHVREYFDTAYVQRLFPPK